MEYKHLRLKLKPDKNQEELLWLHANHSRALRNILVEYVNKVKKETPKTSISKTLLYEKYSDLRKDTKYSWLLEVSESSLNTVTRVLYEDYNNYFKGRRRKPKFHSKKYGKQYFYPRTGKGRLYIKDSFLKIEKVGRVTISKRDLYNKHDIIYKIQKEDKFYRSVVYHDGLDWFISLTYKNSISNDNQVKHTTVKDKQGTLGIDLGINKLATCSDGTIYNNVIMTSYYNKLTRKLKRLQRQVSRKYSMNKDYLVVYLLDGKGKPKLDKYGNHKFKYARKTQNIIKLEHKIKKLQNKMKNIRKNQTHQVTKKIVDTGSQTIVIEDLNVKGMMKNKYRAYYISNSNFFLFRKYLTYKCADRGIDLIVADSWYPSSQTCSSCGYRLEGKERQRIKNGRKTFECPKCNHTQDRDLNASINLSKYNLNR